MSNVPYPGILTPRDGGPVIYGEYWEGAISDVVTYGFITATIILSLSFLLPYVSYWRPQKKREAIMYLGVFVSLYIWCVIMICNFGKEWLRGTVVTQTSYIPGSSNQIQAQVGLHMGLRGINVTLVGIPINQLNQTINYNEQFSWEWQQGIFGHGPYGGRFQREYHESIFRVLPLPILWVAEWFTVEGEYIHWGRFMRIGGWYTHILLWIAMVFWAITNILCLMSFTYGGMGLIVTGCVMILANIVYSGMWNTNYNVLIIPFPDGNITLNYGWCWYLNLLTGIGCIFLGIVLLVYDRIPRADPFFFFETELTTKEDILNNNDDNSEPENKEEMIEMKDAKNMKEEEDDNRSEKSQKNSRITRE